MENERQKAIDAGNILIAQFLGYKYYGHPNEMPGWKKHEGKMMQKLMTYGEIGIRPYLVRLTKELVFHKSWDWLIPALEKCDSIGHNYELTHGMCTIHAGGKKLVSHSPNTINAVWLALTEFINWYNENKPEEI